MKGVVAHAFNHSNQRQKQADFYEMDVNLVYLAHLRPVKSTCIVILCLLKKKRRKKGKERKDVGLSYLRVVELG